MSSCQNESQEETIDLSSGANLTRLTLEPLVDHPKFLKHLAHRIYEEWKVYYERYNLLTPEEIHKDLVSTNMHYDKLPLTLVAIKDDEYVGSISLEIEDGMQNTEFAGLTPWVTNVYVEKNFRRQA